MIVVQRTGSVSPGATSPVSVLCPGKHTAISWGFQAITPVQGKWLAPRYVSSLPIVRKNGGLVGWITRFRNDDSVPLGVRASATCAQGRGIAIRTAGSRAPAAATPDAGLTLRFVRVGGLVEPGDMQTLRAFCPSGTTYVTWGHDLSTSTLVFDRPLIPGDGRVGWEMEVKNTHPTATATVELILVCAEPRGVKLGVAGAGVKRSGHIVLDTTFTHTLSVPTTGNAFFMECLKGVNLGIGFTTPGTLASSPPQLGTWFHRPVTGSQALNPKVRTAAFLGSSAGASVLLQASCWKTNAGFSVPKPGVIDLKLRY